MPNEESQISDGHSEEKEEVDGDNAEEIGNLMEQVKKLRTQVDEAEKSLQEQDEMISALEEKENKEEGNEENLTLETQNSQVSYHVYISASNPPQIKFFKYALVESLAFTLFDLFAAQKACVAFDFYIWLKDPESFS